MDFECVGVHDCHLENGHLGALDLCVVVIRDGAGTMAGARPHAALPPPPFDVDRQR